MIIAPLFFLLSSYYSLMVRELHTLLILPWNLVIYHAKIKVLVVHTTIQVLHLTSFVFRMLETELMSCCFVTKVSARDLSTTHRPPEFYIC